MYLFNKKSVELSEAADAALCTDGQQGGGAELGIIVAKGRVRRTLIWLRERVGDAAIVAAVGQLPGTRKPCLSNLVKLLGEPFPEGLKVTDRDTALKHIAALRAKLTGESER
ncbi:hypothetical protein [Azospira inquinata]|uniref:Cryptic plasmid protein A n=1 Tax=Azospira inquinata TaxID=2785627 RepID=A0A975SPY8_9RHOO|nr:hypothetical protein [Azospira inquinata]QWT47068.1 hypothetical protein J8L76_04990 [Azospira inquinata]QWT50303.1 cryptic plasmid protein A [Azospira inquinata]